MRSPTCFLSLLLVWMAQSQAVLASASGGGDTVLKDGVVPSSACDAIFCHKNAECLLPNGMPFCACADGYEGDGRLVCADKNECLNTSDNVCDASTGSVCIDNDPPQKYSCACRAGFVPDSANMHDLHGPEKCIEVDPCKTGSHGCDLMNGVCTSHYATTAAQGLRGTSTDPEAADTGYTCSCKEGWILGEDGKSCELEKEFVVDVDPCDADPCDPVSEMSCTRDPTRSRGFFCLCKPGFFSPSGLGGSCQYESPCATGTHNCDRNAKCVDLENGFVCICQGKFVGSGQRCSLGTCSEIGDCDSGGSTCKCLMSDEKSMCGDVAPGPVGQCSSDIDCSVGEGCIHNYCVKVC